MIFKANFRVRKGVLMWKREKRGLVFGEVGSEGGRVLKGEGVG